MANKKALTFKQKNANALAMWKAGELTDYGYKNLKQVIRDEEAVKNIARWRKKKGAGYPTSPYRD